MLQLNNVGAGYHKYRILKDINLSIAAGEVLTLVGLNGSGKSTLLKTLLGLIRPQQGSILLEGRELSQWPLHERATKISLLESQPSICFSMSVKELLHLAARRYDPKKATMMIQEALAAVGLNGFENRNILELSSGEAKRALLAHALCGNAAVIMLDEPLAHLDWKHQQELVENLRKWKSKFHTTFVLAVHELEWAVKLSDRLCVMHQGKIIKTDAPALALASPEVCEVFAFQSRIDENPIDGSKRLTLGHPDRQR